jgi:hypothetical protein
VPSSKSTAGAPWKCAVAARQGALLVAVQPRQLARKRRRELLDNEGGLDASIAKDLPREVCDILDPQPLDDVPQFEFAC